MKAIFLDLIITAGIWNKIVELDLLLSPVLFLKDKRSLATGKIFKREDNEGVLVIEERCNSSCVYFFMMDR